MVAAPVVTMLREKLVFLIAVEHALHFSTMAAVVRADITRPGKAVLPIQPVHAMHFLMAVAVVQVVTTHQGIVVSQIKRMCDWLHALFLMALITIDLSRCI
jgi:hypothetical protein